MSDVKITTIVIVIAIFTALLRFLPFLVFGGSKRPPKIIERLSRTLPYAVMGMLVVYCMKGISLVSLSGFLPQLISVAVVVALHIWKRNTLLSIICGTVCYMLLVQVVF